ncbi:TerD family protein [Streptomyces sp. NPDC058001]|uniref:TerD family protein n=1 Tax=Streptomyces sp. NPDC058001 TaxID=3346300 RepID=UPI0036E5D1EF
MSGLNKGLAKVEVAVRWDPSPIGTPAHDLDIVAATYTTGDTKGEPAYLVYFGSRSPDGTITLNRDSQTGQGFGYDEVMVLELDRLAPSYARVVIGVAIQQRDGRRTFDEIANAGIRIRTGPLDVDKHDFAEMTDATAAKVGEFTREASGEWQYHRDVQGFEADPLTFARTMGRALS